jgi:hypothetical protein
MGVNIGTTITAYLASLGVHLQMQNVLPLHTYRSTFWEQLFLSQSSINT